MAKSKDRLQKAKLMNIKPKRPFIIVTLALTTNALIAIVYRLFKFFQTGSPQQLMDIVAVSIWGILLLVIAYFSWRKRKWALIASLVYSAFIVAITPLILFALKTSSQVVSPLIGTKPEIVDVAENTVYALISAVVIFFAYKGIKLLKAEA